jgi:citrate synthase
MMAGSRRTFLTGSAVTLGEILKVKAVDYKEKVAKLKKEKGNESLGPATVDGIYGGMRGITGLVYEPSLLDPIEGIRFRGLTIPECQVKLPKAAGGDEPLPEAMFWLLLTGDVPTAAQTAELNADLRKRARDPALQVAFKAIAALPPKTHPMTQLSIGILALQTGSVFAKAYADGKANKKNYADLALEDALNCIARVPSVAAMIYQRFSGKGDGPLPTTSESDDWAAGFATQLGFSDPKFKDCMRLYLSIHACHEGGNVSAHTTTLVGSALSDPYLSLSAGMNGLAGPLHGLANQEVLGFVLDIQAKLREKKIDMSDDAKLKATLTEMTWDLLKAGNVVPGYGHAVLRRTDPRYTCQREFCLRNFPKDELFLLVDAIYQIMPDILTKHGKTKNPYPNVDAHSGVLLQYYGLKEQDYYTVLFGVSRQLGVLSALVWDRIGNRPIERPKSVTTEWLLNKFYSKAN